MSVGEQPNERIAFLLLMTQSLFPHHWFLHYNSPQREPFYDLCLQISAGRLPLPCTVRAMRPRKTWTLEELPNVNITDDTDVLRKINPEKLAILAGAGVSIAPPGRLPSAFQFLQAFYEVCLPPSCDRNLFLSASSDIRFEMVLGIIQHEFDEDLDILNIFLGGEPNQNHRCLSELARQGAIIITTNFDSLIEQAVAGAFEYRLRASESDFREVVIEDNKNRHPVPEFWHLHGVLEDPSSKERRSESIVASIRDCWSSKALFRLDKSKGRLLSKTLADRDLLVLGYSGSDDYDIAPALEEIRSDRRLIWVNHTSPGEGYDSVGVKPLIRDYLDGYQQGGNFWYRAPCVNSLATILGNGARSHDKVHLLRFDTGTVLQTLSEVSSEQGNAMHDHSAVPSLYSRLVDSVLRAFLPNRVMANQALPLAFREHFINWRDTHVADLLSRYFLAVLICNAGGLYEEEERLLQESTDVLIKLTKAGCTDDRFLRTCFHMSLRAAEHLADSGENYDSEAGYSQMDPEFIDQQPYLKANLLTTLGRIDQTAGRLDQAISHFEESLRIRRSISFVRDIEVPEYDLANALFLKGYENKDLLAAETQANKSLQAALSAAHPEGIARALLLLARINEQLDETANAEEYYRQASEAAYRAGDERLIARCYGEFGFFLWTRISNRRIDEVTKHFERLGEAIKTEVESGPLGEYPSVIASMASGVWEMIDMEVKQQMRPKYRATCEQAASYFAEAFRIHTRHKAYGALLQISTNISECFDFLEDEKRALLADCAAYHCSLLLNNQETTSIALERIKTGAARVFPTTTFKVKTAEEYVLSVRKAVLDLDILI